MQRRNLVSRVSHLTAGGKMGDSGNEVGKCQQLPSGNEIGLSLFLRHSIQIVPSEKVQTEETEYLE